jgi:hypothetical protein
MLWLQFEVWVLLYNVIDLNLEGSEATNQNGTRFGLGLVMDLSCKLMRGMHVHALLHRKPA